MTRAESIRDEIWGQLQQPARLGGTEPRLRLLLTALDTNWRVEEPVYLRPRWGDDGGRVYHFILTKPHASPRLITVPESPLVEQVIRAEGLRVVR